ncbi:MAG: transposase [bacterium]
MPSKNAIKEYESGGYYHIYNRGVDKQPIFRNEQDYKTFLSFLQIYLSPNTPEKSPKTAPSRQLKNYAQEIELISYCLMPNHFHLFVKQNSDHSIDHFMRSFSTKYVRYFNSHYKRIGPLFQGPYKAVRVVNEYQFTYLTKYIHRNALDLSPYKDSPRRLREYKYSSYGNYLRLFHQSWISTADVHSYFSENNPHLSYQNFVEESEPDDVTVIAKLTLDLE